MFYHDWFSLRLIIHSSLFIACLLHRLELSFCFIFCLPGEARCQGVSSPFLEWVFQIWKLCSRGVLGSGSFAQAELVVFTVWWLWSALHPWGQGGCNFHVDGKFEKYAIVFVQADRLCGLIDAPRHRQSALRGRVDWEVEGSCCFFHQLCSEFKLSMVYNFSLTL